MTLVVGLLCRQYESEVPAVIMAADTQITGKTKETGHKVKVYNDLSLLVGCAGSISLTNLAAYRLSRSLRQCNPRIADCESFDRYKHNQAEAILRVVVANHPDVVRSTGFELLVAFSDKNEARLYVVENDGVPLRIEEDTSYSCIGQGFDYGGAVLLHQFWGKDLTTLRGARLAAYLITAVHEVDGTVGEIPEIFECWLGWVGRFRDKAEGTVKERVALRTKTLANFWKFVDSSNAQFERQVAVAFDNDTSRNEIKKSIKTIHRKSSK